MQSELLLSNEDFTVAFYSCEWVLNQAECEVAQSDW
jgi:hypothetical protein